MMIPGFPNRSSKAWLMRKPADLSIWIPRSMSRIRAINEISFPRDSRFGHSPSDAHASYLAALPPTSVAPAHACSGFRAHKVFVMFKQNPFDSRLRSHKIQKLSARYGRVIYAAEIEADLRVVFYVEGDTVVTLDIGSHALYR